MFKFFRKIRQKLIDEGNLRRYLLYAVGEVLLVVIGILIALRVSNWNNQKKNDVLAQKVLSALYDEFTKNKQQLIQVKMYHNRVVDASQKLLDLIDDYPNEYNKVVMDSLLKNYGYYMSFDPYNSALETAISSGDVHLIENDSLINLLFSWPAIVKDSSEEEIQAKQLLFKNKDFLFKYIRELDVWNPIRKSAFKADYPGLLQDPDFENKVFFRQGIVRELVREQDEVLEVNNSILRLIKEEME